VVRLNGKRINWVLFELVRDSTYSSFVGKYTDEIAVARVRHSCVTKGKTHKQMTYDLPAVQTNIRAFIAAVRDQAATSSAAEQSSAASSKKRKRESCRVASLWELADG
jgi:hypothetical protein